MPVQRIVDLFGIFWWWPIFDFSLFSELVEMPSADLRWPHYLQRKDIFGISFEVKIFQVPKFPFSETYHSIYTRGKYVDAI